jgi:hypothetical protein
LTTNGQKFLCGALNLFTNNNGTYKTGTKEEIF